MRSNWSYVFATEDNIDEIAPSILEPPEAFVRAGIDGNTAVQVLVWDPYEKYQIHPNFRGVRRGL